MMALFRDAHNRKLVSIKDMYSLALSYETVISKLRAHHATALRAMRSSAAPTNRPNTQQQTTPQPRAANAGPNANGHGDDRGMGGADGAEGDGRAGGAGGAHNARGDRRTTGCRRPREPSGDEDNPHGPAKRGGRPPQGEERNEESAAHARRRLHLKVYRLVGAAMAMLGGHAALTAFLVYMIRCASCKTGLVRRHVLLSDDIIDQLLDDAQINRIVTKNLDKRRRPPIARFRHARLDGVTVSNMDKLRFASIWTPGHTTLSKDIKQWEQWLATHCMGALQRVRIERHYTHC